MCLKDDIKKAKNSSTIVLSSVNDEGVNLGVNSSEFTITLPPFPNAQNYKQCLIQLKSLHCAPSQEEDASHAAEPLVLGVEIQGLGVQNSYISGMPTDIVGYGANFAPPNRDSATSDANRGVKIYERSKYEYVKNTLKLRNPSTATPFSEFSHPTAEQRVVGMPTELPAAGFGHEVSSNVPGYVPKVPVADYAAKFIHEGGQKLTRLDPTAANIPETIDDFVYQSGGVTIVDPALGGRNLTFQISYHLASHTWSVILDTNQADALGYGYESTDTIGISAEHVDPVVFTDAHSESFEFSINAGGLNDAFLTSKFEMMSTPLFPAIVAMMPNYDHPVAIVDMLTGATTTTDGYFPPLYHSDYKWNIGDQFYILSRKDEALYDTEKRRQVQSVVWNAEGDECQQPYGEVTHVGAYGTYRYVTAWKLVKVGQGFDNLEVAGFTSNRLGAAVPYSVNINSEPIIPNDPTASLTLPRTMAVLWVNASMFNEPVSPGNVAITNPRPSQLNASSDPRRLNCEHANWVNQPGLCTTVRFLKTKVSNTVTSFTAGTLDTHTPTVPGQTQRGTLIRNKRPSGLRVTLTNEMKQLINRSTGGFVNTAAFMDDSLLCCNPFGKTLKCRVIDMTKSTAHRTDDGYVKSISNSNDPSKPAIAHYRSIHETNLDELRTHQIDTSQPMVVKLRAMLIDPDDL